MRRQTGRDSFADVPSAALHEILSEAQHFHLPTIGSTRLNRFGLHIARIAASDAALEIRRLQVAKPAQEHRQVLSRDGVVFWPNFFPEDAFAALRAEARERIARSEVEVPLPSATGAGYGKRQPFAGGFDRFDGGTLNRFLQIDATLPQCRAFVHHPALRQLLTYASGRALPSGSCRLYLTVLADASQFPDVQAINHKDSFHSTIKFWYYIDDCPLENGPFSYSLGSHRMTLARYRWEYRRALSACEGPNSEGSFRVTDQEVAEMGFPPLRPFPVRGNTLVVADTRGFHRRTPGLPGARRLSIHANAPRHPFALRADGPRCVPKIPPA